MCIHMCDITVLLDSHPLAVEKKPAFDRAALAALALREDVDIDPSNVIFEDAHTMVQALRE